MRGNRRGYVGQRTLPHKPQWRVFRYQLLISPTKGWVWRKEIHLFKCRTKKEALNFCAQYYCLPSYMVVPAHKGDKLPEYLKVISVGEDHE